MSQLRSKQLAGFTSSMNWSGVSSSHIPNSYDVKQYLVSKDQMVVENFTGLTIASTSPNWQLQLTGNIFNDEIEKVTVYINCLKTNGINAITTGASGSLITFDAYAYDIDPTDTIKVHYIQDI